MILFVRFLDALFRKSRKWNQVVQSSMVGSFFGWSGLYSSIFVYFLELGQFYGYLTLKCNAIQHEDFRTSHKGCDIWR